MLRVRLLGELQAEADGEPIAMPPEPPRVGAAGVARAAPGRARARPVAARFWPDVLDSSARASLRSALWELRRALGDDDGAGRRPRPDRAALRDRPGRVRAHVAAGRLEAAVALHRGPLLADLDDDWVLEARDEHAERLGAALARLAAAAAPAGGRRRLGAPPARARPARRGRRARPDAPARRRRRPPGALAAYDRLSDRLRERARPGAVGARRARSPREVRDRRRGRRARPPRGRRCRAPPLVGRDHDLAALDSTSGRRCEAARRGRGIGGEARDREDAARRSSCSAAPARTGRAPPAAPPRDLGGGAAVRPVGGAAGRAGA